VRKRHFSSESADATSSSAIQEADIEDDAAPVDLSRAYFPFVSTPAALPFNSFQMCRVGSGGTLRPDNTLADATSAVRSYLRLGGNLIELTRGSSHSAIDVFQELIQDNKIQGEVVIATSISAADLIGFVASEPERWRSAQQRARKGQPAAPGTQQEFVSQLLPAGISAPTSAEALLPLLPAVLPAYLSHFLSLHELQCLDVLLLEPPSVNCDPAHTPDSTFDYMGGVDHFTMSQEGLDAFLRAWFLELEKAVRQGSIKSYGLATARITLGPHAPVTSAPLQPLDSAAAEAVAALPPRPEAPFGSQYYYPLQRVLDLAQEASRRAVEAVPVPSEDAPDLPERGSHLSTIKFPFSLFSAHRLLYSTPSNASSSPSASDSSSFFSLARSSHLLCLGDLPLEDVDPRWNEWVRFEECPQAPLNPKEVLKQYKLAMQNITNLEYVYKRQRTRSAQERVAACSKWDAPRPQLYAC